MLEFLNHVASELVNLDQEAILRFFNLRDPNIYSNSATSDIVDVALSTKVSITTLKLVIKGLLDRYETGFGTFEIENILYSLTMIRFIILAFRYNIKTAAQICLISCIAAYMWYMHFKDINKWYGPLMGHSRLTSKFSLEMAELDAQYKGRRKIAEMPFVNGPLGGFVKGAFAYAGTDGDYRIDPISMAVASIPPEYSVQVQKIYYKLFLTWFPSGSRLISELVSQVTPIMFYALVVRINKKRCPYLIRWHWTFIMIYGVVEGEISRIVWRLNFYISDVLIPSGRNSEALLFQSVFAVVIGLNFFTIYLAMLHAVCGQYFYVPLLTENTEIHIGPRPRYSIYSGGYTSWQESIVRDREFRSRNKNKGGFKLPRVWYGWFGKSRSLSDTKEAERRKRSRKKLKRRQTKWVRKLMRKMKKWITLSRD